MITLYQYIASNAPGDAIAIISKHGYNVAGLQSENDTDGIAACLEQLVDAEGKPAFMDIVALHPDKDVLMEAFADPKSGASKCSCEGKETKSKGINAYLHAATTNSSSQMQQGHIFLIAAALILAVAIVAK